jgi:transposase
MINKQKPMLHIGIDWATQKHDICIQLPDGSRKTLIIDSSPESIDRWVIELRNKYKCHINAAVELCRGPIVYALKKYDFITIFPVNPAMLAKYRQTFSPSGAKDDPTDAEFALDLMLKYPKKVKSLKFASEPMRKLSFLVEQRRSLIEDRRRFSNRLIHTLKEYYPQLLTLFSHRDTKLFMDFIVRWPNLQKLQKAHDNTLRKFFQSHGGNAVTLTEKRIELIKGSIALTNDKAVIESHQLLSTTLAKQIMTIISSIRDYDVEIEKIYKEMPDADLFNSLPGTGVCLAPRLLVAMGENRDRFDSASEVQMYAGIAPVTERSGKKCWIHWRWQCSKFLRQSFIEWSEKSVTRSFWAGLYYNQQREKGSTHQAAVRSLAFKWIRILFKCWKSKTVYSEAKYLQALHDRKSPLITNI